MTVSRRFAPGQIALWTTVGFGGVFLLLPAFVVVPLSFTENEILRWPPRGFTFRWYEKLVDDPLWSSALITSLKVASLTVVAATVLGTATALALERGRFRGKGIMLGLVLSPAIVPVVILAIGIFFVYVRLKLVGSIFGLVMAHTTLALPFVVIAVTTSLRSLDPELEVAASSLGARPLRTFWRITLPLILPGLMAGALFAFITSWDEIVIALFVTTPVVRTLPVVMFTQIREQIDPTVAAASTVLMTVTSWALIAAVLIRRRERVLT
jgi:putative spermidine/putrescine transport system permease protein